MKKHRSEKKSRKKSGENPKKEAARPPKWPDLKLKKAT